MMTFRPLLFQIVWVIFFAASVVALKSQGQGQEADLPSQAEAVLQKHCYQCHGNDGSIEGGINYIVNARRLISRGQVVPGKPERSLLMQRIQAGEMPPEEIEERLTVAEIELVKQWIAMGAKPFRAEQEVRKFIKFEEIVGAIHENLLATPERQRRFIRYFTITHLHNAQHSSDELQTYRHGFSKLINGLSWNRNISAYQPVDTTKTILRIDLRDYNWNAETWEKILDRYPYGRMEDSARMKEIQSWTQTELPFVRADWFVATAAVPPLYHEILKIPQTDKELEDLLQVRVQDDIDQERLVRAGFNSSGISRNNRIIERHESPYGAYWKSYDFAGNAGRQNIFAYPLGPGEEDAFQHAGGEIIFNLPNGLQAYMLTDGMGNRIDKGPTSIVSDPQRPDRTVGNGLSCMSCHTRGLIDKEDQVRSHVQKNSNAFDKRDRETILALYAPRDEFREYLEKDRSLFQEALLKTGAQPSRTEPIVALVKQFEAELDLEQAACEAGISRDQLVQGVQDSRFLSRRLGSLLVEGGTLQRQVYVNGFPDIIRELKLGLCRDHAGELFTSEGHIDRVTSVLYSPDGKWLLSASDDRYIRLWDAVTGEQITRFTKHTDAVRSIAFSPDGSRIASGTLDGQIHIWDVEKREVIKTLQGHENTVYSLYYSKNGQWLASCGMDGTIRRWNVESGAETNAYVAHISWVRSFAVSADEEKFYSAGNDLALLTWDWRQARPESMVRPAHKQAVTAVRSLPKVLRLATVGYDNMVNVWDAKSGRRIHELMGHQGPVTDLAASPDGRFLASVSKDETLRIWNVETGEPIQWHQLPQGHGAFSVAFSPDGSRVATGGLDGVVRFWGVSKIDVDWELQDAK